MTVKDKLNQALKEAVKKGASVDKNILRVAIGEISLVEMRENKKLSDERQIKVLEKLVKSNEDTFAINNQEILKEEIAVLSKFIPRKLNENETRKELLAVKDEIKSVGKSGVAMGKAIGYLKSKGYNFDSGIVHSIVKEFGDW